MRLAKVLVICLMVASLSACVSFPKLHPRILSIRNGMCGEFTIVSQTDACHIVYSDQPVWHPLSYCDGNYALPDTDIAALKEYQAAQCANNSTNSCLGNE